MCVGRGDVCLPHYVCVGQMIAPCVAFTLLETVSVVTAR